MGREQAEQILNGRENGTYLIRESNNYPGDYTLCLAHGKKVEHYRIIYKDNKLTVDEEAFFDNLPKLVQVRDHKRERAMDCFLGSSFQGFLTFL